MTTFLMCDPSHYGVNYQINPWMDVRNQPDRALAIQQWQNLLKIIEGIGCRVEVMSGQPGLPDMVFTANAGLMFPVGLLLSRFRHPERQPEAVYYRAWFEKMGYNVFDHLPEGKYFEGAGDAFFGNITNEEKPGNILYAGHGFRSDDFTSDEEFHVRDVWTEKVVHVPLIDPYFYHLDTCFCPLKDGFALIWTRAFENDFFYRLPSCPDLIHVPEKEAKKFACNAICVGNHVIIPSGCPITVSLLQRAGYVVYQTDMSEFIKAGGACRCLTLRLD